MSENHGAWSSLFAAPVHLDFWGCQVGSLLRFAGVQVAVSKLEWPEAPNGRSKNYALQIGDTVVVQAGGKPPEILTGACSKTWSDVAYYLKVYVSFCGVF